MTKSKLIFFCSTLAIVIYSLLLLYTLYLLYHYNFSSSILFLFVYPNSVLFVDVVLEIVGICLSVLLLKNKIRLKLYVLITISIFILLIKNFVCIWWETYLATTSSPPQKKINNPTPTAVIVIVFSRLVHKEEITNSGFAFAKKFCLSPLARNLTN